MGLDRAALLAGEVFQPAARRIERLAHGHARMAMDALDFSVLDHDHKLGEP